jgi:PIN domain nuclease of toxin-antitoxin system
MSERACVLDASALLALMLREPGWEAVAQRLPTACISAVNLAEVVTKLIDRGSSDDEVSESLIDLDLDVRLFDAEQAVSTGQLRAVTRSSGLSLGDRACLALASKLNAVAITTDRAWADVLSGVSIELAR